MRLLNRNADETAQQATWHGVEGAEVDGGATGGPRDEPPRHPALRDGQPPHASDATGTDGEFGDVSAEPGASAPMGARAPAPAWRSPGAGPCGAQWSDPASAKAPS